MCTNGMNASSAGSNNIIGVTIVIAKAFSVTHQYITQYTSTRCYALIAFYESKKHSRADRHARCSASVPPALVRSPRVRGQFIVYLLPVIRLEVQAAHHFKCFSGAHNIRRETFGFQYDKGHCLVANDPYRSNYVCDRNMGTRMKFPSMIKIQKTFLGKKYKDFVRHALT